MDDGLAGERLVGRVHGGTYLRPEVSNALVDLVSSGPVAGQGTTRSRYAVGWGTGTGSRTPRR